MTLTTVKIFWKGLTTGLILQLAIGPVFFFIVNLALQKTFLDGLMAVLAVTLVDYFYITLAIVGIGKILENKKFKKPLGVISSIVLIVFGILMIQSSMSNFPLTSLNTGVSDLVASFLAAFLLTISSPMAIVFNISFFATKAVENNFSRRELYIFGIAFGLSVFLFMGTSVLIFSFLKTMVPIMLIQTLNGLVGALLVSYGIVRLIKVLRQS